MGEARGNGAGRRKFTRVLGRRAEHMVFHLKGEFV